MPGRGGSPESRNPAVDRGSPGWFAGQHGSRPDRTWSGGRSWTWRAGGSGSWCGWRPRWSSCWPPLWRSCLRWGWGWYWRCFDAYYAPYDCWQYDCNRGYAGVFSARPTYATVYSPWYSPEAFPPQPCAATLDEAFALLAGGAAGDAYDAFDCLVDTGPTDGVAMTGLALSAATLGDDEQAAKLLRAAVRDDPAALLYVPEGDALDAIITGLAGRYDQLARTNYGDLDSLFMVAALRVLLGDAAGASYALDVATALGDTDPSVVALRGMVEGGK